MNSQISILHRYLKKEGHNNEAELLKSLFNIVKNSSFQNKTLNEIVEDVFEKSGRSKEKITDVNLGSEVEYRYDEAGVLKLTTIDKLNNGNILCKGHMKLGSVNTKFKEYSLYEKFGEDKEALREYVEENRLKEQLGNYNQYINHWIFGGPEDLSYNIDNIIAIFKHLYEIPGDFEVFILDEFVNEGVTTNDLIDFATDISSVLFAIGEIVYSGGIAVVAKAAMAFRMLYKGSLGINIMNNLYGGRFLEATIGIICLFLNIKNGKKITRFWVKHIREQVTGVPLKLMAPQYFISLLNEFINVLVLVMEQIIGVIDDKNLESLKEFFDKDLSESEIFERIKDMTASTPSEKVNFAIEYYKKDGAKKLMESAEKLSEETLSATA